MQLCSLRAFNKMTEKVSNARSSRISRRVRWHAHWLTMRYGK